MGRIIGMTNDTIDADHRHSNRLENSDRPQLADEKHVIRTSNNPSGTSPYSNITVGRVQTASTVPSRQSLSVDKRPKQKVRKPSKEFLNTKSGRSIEQQNDGDIRRQSLSDCRRI
jgi:hypothetical protein